MKKNDRKQNHSCNDYNDIKMLKIKNSTNKSRMLVHPKRCAHTLIREKSKIIFNTGRIVNSVIKMG